MSSNNDILSATNPSTQAVKTTNLWVSDVFSFNNFNNSSIIRPTAMISFNVDLFQVDGKHR